MGEQFQNHGRNGRQTGFAIIAIPHATSCPFNTETIGDVLLKSGHYHIRQVSGCIAGYACIQFSVIKVSGVDTQCTYQCISFGEAGITMYTQGHLDRYSQSLFYRIVDGTSTYVIYHSASGVDVIVVVVLTFGTVIYFGWHPCPLGVVSGTFQIAWHTTCLPFTGNVSHTSTETDGIGTNHSFLCTLVA